ncbi:poly(A) RNA polymerase gld-2 homolog A-like isoform X1 [Euwallacea fornicatus]|uniref:poly(A) RNA polymerase gld-2 homolog A-like isoform X1 n=1 Tax=Euwallacea fornicatus TaxID=995702 RepID=UPI003390777A
MDRKDTNEFHRSNGMNLYRPIIMCSAQQDRSTTDGNNNAGPFSTQGFLFAQINTQQDRNSTSEESEEISPHGNKIQRGFRISAYCDQHDQSTYHHPSNRPYRRNYVCNRNFYSKIARRVYGLRQRFLERILEIDPKPSRLLTGGPYDRLSQAVYDVYKSKAQKPQTYINKIERWKELFLSFTVLNCQFGLYIVGSTMTGFGANTSDIDMCLLMRRSFSDDPRQESLYQLELLKMYLKNRAPITRAELILARIPILKLMDDVSGFEIDLNYNNTVGLHNTHLLYCYSQCDWRVRPLVIMVKEWAQVNRINDAKKLTVSSYSWTLMVIQYLQCGVFPAILPCLHSLCPAKFNVQLPGSHVTFTDVHESIREVRNYRSSNTETLGELFIGFLGYYANFDFKNYAISVRNGSPILIDHCKRMNSPKNDPNQWKFLCIEEPFEHTNTARSVWHVPAFLHIKIVIRKSYEELKTSLKLRNVLPLDLIEDLDEEVLQKQEQ